MRRAFCQSHTTQHGGVLAKVRRPWCGIDQVAALKVERDRETNSTTPKARLRNVAIVA